MGIICSPCIEDAELQVSGSKLGVELQRFFQELLDAREAHRVLTVSDMPTVQTMRGKTKRRDLDFHQICAWFETTRPEMVFIELV